MKKDLERQVLSYMQEKQMITPGMGVVIALSGGADSVCLLRLMVQLRRELELELMAVHVEHGIRGKEALEDAAFAQKLCQRLLVPCKVYHCDIPGLAAERKISQEEAGRQERYRILEEEAEGMERLTGKPWRIAVAHHADDNAETMLYHLARGTGIRGLCGIPPVRGRIIRPLLAVSKEEIVDWLKELGQDYCLDATNDEDCYQRNRIRHHVLPQMQQVNPGAVNHINQTAELMGELDLYLQQQASEILEQAKDERTLKKEPLLLLPEFLRREVLHRWLMRLPGGAKDITWDHVVRLSDLIKAPVGKELQLPGNRSVISGYDCLEFWDGQRFQQAGGDAADAVTVHKDTLTSCGKMEVEFAGKKWRLMLRQAEKTMEIPIKSYTKWFDYDKIERSFQIRNRQEGDYLVFDDAGRRKSLARYLIDEKIPRKMRDDLPLLCCGDHVMWIPGYRMSVYFKVEHTTERILEVQFMEESEDE